MPSSEGVNPCISARNKSGNKTLIYIQTTFHYKNQQIWNKVEKQKKWRKETWVPFLNISEIPRDPEKEFFFSNFKGSLWTNQKHKTHAHLPFLRLPIPLLGVFHVFSFDLFCLSPREHCKPKQEHHKGHQVRVHWSHDFNYRVIPKVMLC